MKVDLSQNIIAAIEECRSAESARFDIKMVSAYGNVELGKRRNKANQYLATLMIELLEEHNEQA